MHLHHLNLLISPKSKKPLQIFDAVMEGDRVKEGTLSDGEHSYPIKNFIPRFAEEDDDTWSEQWNTHPAILHEESGLNLYKKRFTEETRWPDDLSSELIMEAGCGSGSFTKHAIATGATVVTFDLSNSVDNVYKRFGENSNILIVQASIYDLPFPQIFDRVFCFGVIQHTPVPQKSLENLVGVLKPGGSIATDIYADVKLTFRHGLLRAKYFLRKWTVGKHPKTLHSIVKSYVNLMWPICKVMRLVPGGIYVSQHLMIDDYSTRMSGMKPEHYREYAIIEIFDMLAPNFDNPASLEDYQKWHKNLNLTDIDVHYGYNGIEARAKKRITS